MHYFPPTLPSSEIYVRIAAATDCKVGRQTACHRSFGTKTHLPVNFSLQFNRIKELALYLNLPQLHEA